MNRIGIMQITDTLSIGGLEQMAVNLANSLPRDHYRSYVCATRQEGELRPLLASHVKYLFLRRTGRFDLAAMHRLARYVDENQIHILHAHGTSVFIAAVVSMLRSGTRVLWHDHFGRADSEKRTAWIYNTASRAIDGVVAVTENLADWSRQNLRIDPGRVWYIPNFVSTPSMEASISNLPGTPGSRIVCVANLRPQKDHLNLLRAMKLVIRENPEAHLILLGSAENKTYLQEIKETISQEGLAANVSWLGPRLDVPAILRSCDIGVLSSASEGLPLALIEYGMAGLASVATKVGQCTEVLNEGCAGILVPPCSPTPLAEAITTLLRSPKRRFTLGKRFTLHAHSNYSAEAVVKKICTVYNAILR